jgi:hypothetical protein
MAKIVDWLATSLWTSSLRAFLTAEAAQCGQRYGFNQN